MLRVFSVDPHPIVRHVVRCVCERSSDLVFAGEAASGADAIRACLRAKPAIVVTELVLPDMDGVDLVRTLRAADPTVRVLVLTGRTNQDGVLAYLQAGVVGYVEKTAGPEEVAAAIRLVGQGGSLISEDLRRHAGLELGASIRRTRETNGALASLTGRELEVLRCLCEGATSVEVARRLGLSKRTIEGHILGARRKLGVANRAAAVARAASLGLAVGPPAAGIVITETA